MNDPKNDIKVSVSIITYNQKNFIGRAIESVLKQKVNFKYELIIGDDFSNDGTREILQEYQKKYPEIISLILHPRRYNCVPGRINNITNLYCCSGDYIAMLDGDDYWLSEEKLQTQANFLDAHPDYVLSFHDALMISEEKLFESYHSSSIFDFLPDKDATFEHKDVVKCYFMQTSTLFFRNFSFKEFPEWFWDIYSADYAIQLLVSQEGKIKYFHHLESVRRVNKDSFTVVYYNTLTDNKLRLNEIKIFSKHFPEYRKLPQPKKELAKLYLTRASFFAKRKKNLGKASFYIFKALTTHQIALSELFVSTKNNYNRFRSKPLNSDY